MQVFRSLLFNFIFFGSSAFILVGALILLPFPRKATQKCFQIWMKYMMWLLKVLVGLDYKITGRENLPEGPVVIACKHQSAWDVGIFLILFSDPAYILKKELLSVPVYGWLLRKTRMIAINRDGGASALKDMMQQTRKTVAAGRSVVIFPEGTRSAPDCKGTYHPGVAALYKTANVPLVPAALNSGCFWSRRGFTKRPGTITLEFQPPISKGLKAREFMEELENCIETASRNLQQTVCP
jgi:1-acyl-sn-glycerol-3-phosphate acyltransferase